MDNEEKQSVLEAAADRGVLFKAKDSSKIMKVASWFLWFIGMKRKFMENYWTTWGGVIYYPTKVGHPWQGDSYKIIAHEMIHVEDHDKWGYWMEASYVLFPVPFFFAWFRWRWEREAYLLSIVAYGRDVERTVQTLWHNYGWCWPRFLMRRWFNKKIQELEQEGVV